MPRQHLSPFTLTAVSPKRRQEHRLQALYTARRSIEFTRKHGGRAKGPEMAWVHVLVLRQDVMAQIQEASALWKGARILQRYDIVRIGTQYTILPLIRLSDAHVVPCAVLRRAWFLPRVGWRR